MANTSTAGATNLPPGVEVKGKRGRGDRDAFRWIAFRWYFQQVAAAAGAAHGPPHGSQCAGHHPRTHSHGKAGCTHGLRRPGRGGQGAGRHARAAGSGEAFVEGSVPRHGQGSSRGLPGVTRPLRGAEAAPVGAAAQRAGRGVRGEGRLPLPCRWLASSFPGSKLPLVK